MKKSLFKIPRIVLCCVLLLATSVARADGTGKLQFLYTAYLDVPALISNMLASCEQFDPSTRVELQRLYDQWNQKHGRYQKELQQLLFKLLSEQMGEAKAQEFIAHLKTEVQNELGSLYFPQNHAWTDNWSCTKGLPDELTGKGLMLDYADYVEELKQKVK
ncbi:MULTISPECIES: hypothetical protein [Acinetobacter]|uniref:hypothetical protein n=1 Tax=Acinetobacter TaxID=469 RepID=UPI0004D86ACF|nr:MULTISPECIES: hypothetical protein [unclassified Acinetobacter]KEC82613.1 hypothetical protein DT74_22265 [Acinetobacter sp. ETR1]WEE40709.1 hypothetical protein PYV58_06010 [Acinetobacter sp. TAC-1]